MKNNDGKAILTDLKGAKVLNDSNVNNSIINIGCTLNSGPTNNFYILGQDSRHLLNSKRK